MAERSYRTIHQIIKAAQQNLDQTSWDYLIGGSDTETTLNRNRLSLDSLALKPRVLVDVSDIDTSGSLLGEQMTIPALLAPIGSLQLFDEGGGFYRGTDIIKAMALGADAVGLGRLEAWALAAGGAPALVRCLTILQREIHIGLGLLGVNAFSELDPSFITPANPVTSADVISAFPLLDLNDCGY